MPKPNPISRLRKRIGTRLDPEDIDLGDIVDVDDNPIDSLTPAEFAIHAAIERSCRDVLVDALASGSRTLLLAVRVDELQLHAAAKSAIAAIVETADAEAGDTVPKQITWFGSSGSYMTHYFSHTDAPGIAAELRHRHVVLMPYASEKLPSGLDLLADVDIDLDDLLDARHLVAALRRALPGETVDWPDDLAPELSPTTFDLSIVRASTAAEAISHLRMFADIEARGDRELPELDPDAFANVPTAAEIAAEERERERGV